MPALLGQVLRGNETFERLTRFFRADADPWERLEVALPHQVFGRASNRNFERYLEGPCRAEVRSLKDLCEFLLCCEAIDDHSLFQEADFWQHPVTFEQLRKGDCEDHALWAWRQLHRLAQPALFVAGLWRGTAHAWVVVRLGEEEHILEATAKADPMLIPADVARRDYIPAVAVDHQLRTFAFQGYQQLHQTQENGERDGVPRPAPGTVLAGKPPSPGMAGAVEIVILAGGLGSRLGRDKARVRLGGRSLLSWIRWAAAPLGYPLRIQRRDRMERCGPLGGVVTALEKIRPGTGVVLFLACDMPMIQANLLARILERTGPRTPAVFAAHRAQIGFPFSVRVDRLGRARRLLEEGGRSLGQLAESLGARRWEVPVRWQDQLFNVNTSADLAELRRRLSRRRSGSDEQGRGGQRRTRAV